MCGWIHDGSHLKRSNGVHAVASFLSSPAAPQAGTKIIIGRCPRGVGIRLLGGKLVSQACAAQGLCVLAGAGPGSVALGNCSSAHAGGWALQPGE